MVVPTGLYYKNNKFLVGKIIASAAIMSGVLVLALPITIIVDNFIKVAQDEQQAEQYKEAELQLLMEEMQ